ncbi:MAG: NAD(P)/FAD-dependent oxidoreductase [Gammaproteobacteria bacterium]|nr:NAD(P)/FAD-dependent oxidoreductase [Gammaproteobacteria bacterium]MCW8841684.1 NAD(P)/FAD-dependent oxidoreductase [Gammaproteobacteria bacterium]MCW8958513.1 NAD(P)/FAD-dependent oxidoreductase [Gammaproteobacteria bacterium]MCW8973656.1 NAD(P)/FAD-dependent oxidoreductase [Gammaproteobacteria bacterium]MCW8991684.1 NAD(P)/FAD-dependent oxidoreductase [Gammaproteobacteria bacterium]
MAHVVIIGASTGGLPAAYDTREILGKEHEVTVISDKENFTFVPSNPWVAVGWRTRSDISFPLEPYLKRKGINFIPQAATEIKPDENTVIVADGSEVKYDYLILATGPKLVFDEVEGMGPGTGNTVSVCTTDHAEEAYDKWQQFVEDPGHIVVGAAPFASCFGPAYEFAFIMDTDLRKRKMRDRVPMTFVTSEPYIGHLGLGGVGDSKGMLESEMRDRHIKWITNARTTKVEPGKMTVEELDDKGEVKKTHELEFKYSMMLPAFKGVDAVNAVGEDLVNPRGFVKVNDFQQNPKWKNIYGIGVGIAIPPVEPTPVPTGTPKTGYMIESMVLATAHNIANDIAGKAADQKATWNAICLADMGDTGAAFVAMPQIPPRNVSWMKKGKWVHMAKVAFEKYFISKMKKGSNEPVFEKYILKALGIMKLK